MKKLRLVLVVAASLAAAAAGFVAWSVHAFLGTAVSVPAEGQTFVIRPGTSLRAVARQLVEDGVVETDVWYRVYARVRPGSIVVQAGEYRIAAGTTARGVLEQFASGDVTLYSFTIVEGWNHRDLLTALRANDAIEQTMSDEDWPVLLAELEAGAEHPEGLFLPETYRFPRNTTDREVLAQAYGLMQTVLEEEWRGRGEAAGVSSPYETLILASIVEKETARADERARIAGVFTRRLERRMRLQTDPTVIYGIGPGFDGNLTRKDLRTDTPYNTYTRHGLPPTPIAMPGRDAIHAVLHPGEGEELYFVATGLGDGSHKFSVTKSEHDTAVAEYLQRLRRQRNSGS